MPKRILTFLNKEFSGINEAALLLGGFALFSQLLGLIRDRSLASFIGAGPVLDIYYAAFRIPDFLYISIGSLVSITVILPFLSEKISKEDNNKEAKNFLSNIFTVYMLFMIIISAIIFFIMPYIAKYIAPGFNENQLSSLVTTSRIMLLSPIFIGFSNLNGSVTQLFKNFFIFSLSPIFYNLGILFGIIFLYPIFGVHGLALGVILGAVLHLLIQIPSVIDKKLFPTFIFNIKWKEIWKVAKLSLPRTITLSCNSLAFLVLISMASTIKDGSISLFTFSYNLQSVPVGIIGISYSVAAFPTLVKSFSSKNINIYIDQIINTSKQIIFWSIPVIALIVVLRAQIVRVVLGAEAFSWSDTKLTAAAVALFVVSLTTQSLVLLFVRGYYAASKTRKPLIINTLSSVLVIVFAFVFIKVFKYYPNFLSSIESLLRVENVEGTEMLSLPLAYVFGSVFNFFLIWFSFKKDFLLGVKTNISRTFLESILSAMIIGIISYFCLNVFDKIFFINTFWGIFLQGFLSGLIGIMFGIFVLYFIKNKEFIDIVAVLKKKIGSSKVIAQEQPEL